MSYPYFLPCSISPEKPLLGPLLCAGSAQKRVIFLKNFSSACANLISVFMVATFYFANAAADGQTIQQTQQAPIPG